MQNICEKLLFGVVPPSRIESMIKDPGGSLWQDEAVKRRLRARLHDSMEVFESIVTNMREAMMQMMKRLGLGPDGQALCLQAQEASKSSFVKEIKRAAFTISRSTYVDLIAVIRSGISDLETLTDQNVGLEPKRQERSQVKLLALLRELSLGLYRALRQSLSCTCNHSINFKLFTQPSDVIYGETEAKILEELDFHLSFFCRSGVSQKEGWEDLRIQAVPAQEMTSTLALKNPPEALAADLLAPGSKMSKGKSVRFHYFSSSDTLSASTTPILKMVTNESFNGIVAYTESKVDSLITRNQELMSDFCEKIRQSQGQERSECYGFIADMQPQVPRKYRVYSVATAGEEGRDSVAIISLRQALLRTIKVPPLSYKDKLQLAVVISTGVLQLYDTPWLPRSFSSDDIVFMKKRNEDLYNNTFVGKGLPETSLTVITSSTLSIKRNPTLLCLGFLLIELILGQSLQSYEGEDPTENNLDQQYIAAQNLLPRVRIESLNYFSATFMIKGTLTASHSDITEALNLAKRRKLKSVTTAVYPMDKLPEAVERVHRGEVAGRLIVNFKM
ncbi:Fc.00g083050.m01.CDS01 [Cosmosporella sp. VM-42]